MIEIITEEVVMPELDKRRFQKHPKDSNGAKWTVEDTEHKTTIYSGNYQKASLICHNLNKKHYRNQ